MSAPMSSALSQLQASRARSLAAIEARQAAVTDALLEVLALFLLACTLLYVLIGFAPFQHDVVSYSTDTSTINRWVWLGLVLLGLPILALRWRHALRLARAIWPMLLLYAWFGASTFWALDRAASVRRFLFYVVALMVFAAISVGVRRVRATHLVLVLGTGLVVLIDLGSAIVAPGLAMTDLGLAGIHPHKNAAGAIGLYALLAAITYWPVARSAAARGGSAVLGGLAFVLLLLARSTTSTVIALGALLVLPMLLSLLRRPALVIAAIAATVAGLVGVVLFLYFAWAGIEGRDALAPLAGITFTNRIDVWAFTVSEIAKRPLLGAGFASFWDINPLVQPSLYKGYWFASDTEYTNEAHNGYLDLVATTGFIGLGLALLVLGRALFLAFRAVARARSGGTALFHLGFLLAFVVHNLMESSYFVPNNPFGTLLLFSALQLESWGLGPTGPSGVPSFRIGGQSPSPSFLT
ncbi:MAG: O-antigen ligase family protein [Acidisphaera sp.]|nr:O-antigen ligase family protein [Acidisphaera sp.]